MKLVDAADIPRVGIEQTFRHSRVAPLITFVILAGATIWWTIAFPLQEGARWQHWLPTGLGVLMSLIVVVVLRKALRPANWLMHVTPDGLYIKFRSYLNEHIRDGQPTVVLIPYSEIQSVKGLRQTVTLPEARQKTDTNTVRFLDINLTHQASDELSAALRHERSIEAGEAGGSKYHDYPLRVAQPDRLRLLWKFSPGIGKAEEILQRKVTVNEMTVLPDLRWEQLDETDKDELIRELAEFGQRMTAKKLAKERHDMSTSEASRFVDEILGKA